MVQVRSCGGRHRDGRRVLVFWTLALVPLLLGSSGVEARRVRPEPPESAWIFAPDFSTKARGVPTGRSLIVEDVPLPEATGAPRSPSLPRSRSLELESFRVFAADAKITVHTKRGHGHAGHRSLGHR